ncbi:MAG: V-type ATP synthase subunit E [Acutalibacteraceae bacterium]
MHKSYKSSNFLKTIDKYTRRQQSKIMDEIKRHEDEELKKAESEIIEDTNNMIQKELIAMKNRVAIEVSQKELEQRKSLSLRRGEMMEEIFEDCRKRLIDFTQDKEKYSEHLKNCVKKIRSVLVAEDVELFISERDLKYKALIEEAFGRKCSVVTSKEIKIGGAKGVSAEQGIIVDETLSEKLSESWEWAAETFGVLLV